ncbi:MAG: SPOR domain-containing protein [Tannerella sp.]|nr:SPOR domain-containing protein [Tannerella sp.]
MFLLDSCKSKQSNYKTAYEEAKSNHGVEEEIIDEDEDIDEVLTEEEVSYESVKPEKVKPVSGENSSVLKKYSVVIGSFKNRTNAYNMKDRMVAEGYSPVVAENEYGMLRVIVTSFDSKADAARSRDSIKAKFKPNFQDAWLLERQY